MKVRIHLSSNAQMNKGESFRVDNLVLEVLERFVFHICCLLVWNFFTAEFVPRCLKAYDFRFVLLCCYTTSKPEIQGLSVGEIS